MYGFSFYTLEVAKILGTKWINTQIFNNLFILMKGTLLVFMIHRCEPVCKQDPTNNYQEQTCLLDVGGLLP